MKKICVFIICICAILRLIEVNSFSYENSSDKENENNEELMMAFCSDSKLVYKAVEYFILQEYSLVASLQKNEKLLISFNSDGSRPVVVSSYDINTVVTNFNVLDGFERFSSGTFEIDSYGNITLTDNLVNMEYGYEISSVSNNDCIFK